MDSNKQYTVGFFALIGMALLLWGWGWLKSFSLFSAPQRFTAQFSDVAGLARNAPVNIQGVRVGTVETMDFVHDNQHPDHNDKINCGIKVTDSTVRVPEGSHISIQTLGLVGAKYIEIVLPRDAAGHVINGRPLGTNDILVPPEVEEPVRIELVMNRVASRVGDIVDSIDTDQASKAINNFSQAAIKLNKNMDTLKETAESVKTASNEIGTTANKFGKTADNAEAATERASSFFKTGDDTLHNIQDTSLEFKGTARRINKILDNPNLSGDLKDAINKAKETVETIRGMMTDLENTMKDKDMRNQMLDLLMHLEKSTENVKGSLDRVHELAGDQSLRSDIKDVVKNAKDAIEQARGLMSEPGFKSDLGSTLGKIRNAADNVDVVAHQLHQILSKRAPLIQMMVGRPGKLPPKESQQDDAPAPKTHMWPLRTPTPPAAPAPGTP